MTGPEVQTLLVAVARVETKLDMMAERSEEHREQTREIEKRVDALEGWRSWLAGAWAILASLLAYIGVRVNA